MSVVNGTDFSPFEDKELDTFTTSFNCPSNGFFDQCYSSEGHTESSNNSNKSNFFDELDMGLSDQISFENPIASKATLPHYRPLHSWRANAWRHHKVVTAPQSQKLLHRMRPDGAAISGVELLSLEGKVQLPKPTLNNISTPPSTPPGTPGRIHDSTRPRPSTPVIPILGSHRVSKKKSTPNMMHPSSYAAKQDSPSFYEWTERFEQFSLQAPQNNLPLSPPSSAKVSQQKQPSRLIMPIGTFKPMSPESPTNLVQRTSRRRRHSRIPSSNGYIPTMQSARHSARWMQSPQLDFSLGSTPLEHDWSSVSNAPLYDHDSAAHSQNQDFMQLGLDFATQGLMINCEPFEDIFQDNQPTNQYLAAPFDPFESECAVEDDDYGSDISPENGLSAPAAQYHASRSHSPSPPSSPQTPSNSRRRTRQPRRKSSAIALPRTPKTPTSSGGAVGFVNFTPSDSRKILGGVAPSGSSKTKARREKEASDRRRKLSEAAAKAVMEAGGDVEALRKEGLLI